MNAIYMFGLMAASIVAGIVDQIVLQTNPTRSSRFESVSDALDRLSAGSTDSFSGAFALIANIVGAFRDIAFWNYSFITDSVFAPIQWILAPATAGMFLWVIFPFAISIIGGGISVLRRLLPGGAF